MNHDVRLTIAGTPFGRVITLERTPLFLRFVVVGEDPTSLDALDQPADVPESHEQVFAARWVKRSRYHIDRVVKGRGRVGEWRTAVTYELLDPQPPVEVLRDTERWQEWATEEYKKEKTTT